MKILAIRGKNLASLAGEFEVDFEQEPLKSSGLFAISGPTGAGKSTLLDALCMALYEKTPRLFKAGGIGVPDVGDSTVTQQDARNLLRRGTADGYAEVDFVGTDGIGYRARWSVRRARGKADGSLQKTGMSLKQLPALQPIGGTNREVLAQIERSIGLSFEQFTRAVLLAQNEFSAFLKADDNERGELLETLTGSAIYSTLSQRAHARAKQEQQELQRLTDRLADQKPLDDDARRQLEQDSQAANAAVAALDLRKNTLETALRWHQDDEKFQRHEQLAREQLAQRQAEQAAAAERRAELQRIESVQAARPLVVEVERLARDLANDQNAIAACHDKLHVAEQHCLQAEAALQITQGRLQAAEQAQAGAAPMLDQAKALDARIEALLPGHRQAQQAQAEAEQAAAQARQHLRDKHTELGKAQEQQHDTERWLAQHAALQRLAEQWPRWDILLIQAHHSRNEISGIESILASLSKAEAQQNALIGDTAAALTAAATALVEADQQRQHATQLLAGFDSAALQTRKQGAETRRDQLAGAEQTWHALADQESRQQALDAQARISQQAVTEAEAALGQINAQLPALAAAQTQAERSLKNAEAACSANVETLRAALETDAPCPVCGATEHPYASAHPQLRAMLASLHGEVEHCRQQQQHAQRQHAMNSADAASHRRQLDAIGQEQQQLQAASQRLRAQFQAHPLAAEWAAELQSDSATAAADWCARQRESVQNQLREIQQIEDDWRRAAQVRDRAQAAFEHAASEHSIRKEAAGAAQAALTEIQGRQRASNDQLRQTRQRLDASLDQLDAAFDATDATDAADDPDRVDSVRAEHDPGAHPRRWRRQWQADPSAFHAQCAEHARQWQAHCTARDQGRQRHATLALETKGLQEALQKAELEQQRAAGAFAASDASLKHIQAQRQALFDGQPVQQVEARLAEAVNGAKTLLAQQSQASIDSRQSQIRQQEALDQAKARLASHQREAQAAEQGLQDWIADFAKTHRGHTDVASVAGAAAETTFDAAALRALLAHPAAWISSERAALQAIDAAAQQAATVLHERSLQRQAHQQQRPPEDGGAHAAQPPAEAHASAPQRAADLGASPLDALQRALQALAAERQNANAAATALQLELKQDQARRAQAADMLGSIASQEARYRVWAQLNELIGSADGKKFRNYAQQITLDILLGYANRHLNELSRRYRLQRISDTLALMVVDQDMGDELRSVHSLSGGESFLVSLALALGLASLSSNRVRVESLFIDEGFGSLDADTLRVAMDALDGLQAMGRKVGVISHVQEMTERIATKVLVQRTAGGRSLVGIG